MKITIENTTKIVQLDGVPARVWEGQTESGIHVVCFITRIAINENEPRTEEFKNELSEQSAPSAEVQAIPLSLIL